MKKSVLFIVPLMVGVVLGGVAMAIVGQDDEVKPAYMIVAAAAKPGADAEALAAYGREAGPLAQEAGLSVVARGEAKLLEGEWPYEGVTIEVFPSMKKLEDFWYSEAYQNAKKHREGQAIIHFIVAVEGI